MKIGELVQATGLTERMLRHYEQLGIITPSRSEGGTRQYDEEDLAVAQLMRQLRALDIPLETVAEIAQERSKHSTGNSSCLSVGALLEDLAEQLSQKAERALSLRRIIMDAEKSVQECKGCENLPSSKTCPDCPMNRMAEDNPVAALIWG